jgi:hypothetical protein
VDGPKDGWYLNAIIQEIDIATGAVLFNWTSIDHIPFSESYNNITQTGQGNSSFPWDPVHINSIDKVRFSLGQKNKSRTYARKERGRRLPHLGAPYPDDLQDRW